MLRIRTSRRMKESGDNVGQSLQLAHRTFNRGLELFFRLRCLFPELRLHVRPGQFIRIQLRRIRRQKEQLDFLGVLFNKVANQFRLMRRMPFYNQEDLALHTAGQTLEKVAKYSGVHAALNDHATKMPERVHRREHVEGEACPARLDNRRAPFRRPVGTSMMIGADSRLVSEEHQCFLSFGPRRNLRLDRYH